MHRLITAFTVTASVFAATGAHAADPQAETLRQEVVTAVQRAAPMRAELTFITSHYESGFGFQTSGRPRRTRMVRTPHQVRRKVRLAVTSGQAGSASQFSTPPGDNGTPKVDLATLAYVGDPFLSEFRGGFPQPADPRLYAQNVHYVGVENKDGVDYRVFQADKLIVTAPAAMGQEARARVAVTNWRWYIGPDGLIHRLTWENHEGVSGNETVERDEVIVNAYTKG